MLLTHTKRSRKTNLERSSPRSLLATRMRRDRIKTPDGCKGGWTCAKHAPGGRGAEGRLRVNSRYYNPTDGRWTRRDPIGLVGGMNLYTFLKKCPVNATDILGHRELEDIMIDIAGIIGSTWASYLTMIAEEHPNEVEYCGLICKNLNSESIVITTPKRGISTTTISACSPDASPCPRCYNKVGAYHSHTKNPNMGLFQMPITSMQCGKIYPYTSEDIIHAQKLPTEVHLVLEK